MFLGSLVAQSYMLRKRTSYLIVEVIVEVKAKQAPLGARKYLI